MTGDRERQLRESIERLIGDVPGSSSQRREPADAHFRRLGERAPEALERLPDAAGTPPCRFEVYRADEVPTSSTQFAGGDWHWRLCDGAGRMLVDAGGYGDEQACRAAVSILRERAANATAVTSA